jgi:hypothetical protein
MRDSKIAWIAAAAHVVAAAAMLLLLRVGLPPAPDDERIAYITTHRVAWTGGWLTWQLAVLSLIALYAVLARRISLSSIDSERFGGLGALPLAALAIGTAGASIDVATQMRFIVILPKLRGEAFALLDRELEAMTGYAANGLYTLAFVLFVIAGWREMPRLANALAAPIAVSGFALAIASLLHHALGEIVSSAILFPLFTVWTILIARWLRNA